MLLMKKPEIERRALALQERLEQLKIPGLNVQLVAVSSKAGGGSLPLLELPSWCVGIALAGISANALEKSLRLGAPPIIGRIVDDKYLIDLRTVMEDELELIATAIQLAASQQSSGDDA